jgi:hypothetical protein
VSLDSQVTVCFQNPAQSLHAVQIPYHLFHENQRQLLHVDDIDTVKLSDFSLVVPIYTICVGKVGKHIEDPNPYQ